LAAVLFALILLGALAAAGFAAALGEWRAGRATAGGLAAAAGARVGLAMALERWDPRWSGTTAPGGERDLGGGAVPGGTWRVRALRTAPGLLLVRSEGRAAEGGGRRVLGLVAMLRAMTPHSAAAALLREAPSPSIAARIIGTDEVPPGWDCASAVPGTPAVAVDSLLSEEAFFSLGGKAWSEVIAWAEAVPEGGDSLTVRLERSGTVLVGGRHLGTIIVDGNLELRAGASVTGIVLARGDLVVGAGGGAILGTLVARSIRLAAETFPASLQVAYSGCAVARSGGSRAAPEALPGASILPLW
jgi:hypothetical protein